MTKSKSFSISKALTENTHPYTKVFEAGSGAFAGLEITYRDLPENWSDIAESEVGEELEGLGFDPSTAVQHLVSQVELTGEDYLAYKKAEDRLTTKQKASLPALVKRGFGAVLSEVIGEWNNADHEPDAEYLATLPASFLRSVFLLASNVTMGLEQRDFLGK